MPAPDRATSVASLSAAEASRSRFASHSWKGCTGYLRGRRSILPPHHSDTSDEHDTHVLGLRCRDAKLPEGDWRSCRPLGISCAATLLGDGREPVLWHGGDDRARPADRMSREETATLVRYLSDQVERGYTLLTWNGVGFDLDVLAEESRLA